MVTKKWFNIMVQNKWLEQPPLAPNRKEIAKKKLIRTLFLGYV